MLQQNKNRAKKRMAIDFRRFITWKGSGKNVRIYLGAEIIEIREWIESNWQPEMSWSNYGKLWVIDHIVPIRMFDLESPEDMKICWHYKNLMPLLKDDNLKKEGNCFFSFELLFELKDKDHFYRKLFDRVKPEVEWMAKYIAAYHKKYKTAPMAQVKDIKVEKQKTA